MEYAKIFFILVLLFSVAYADVIPPGSHSVSHTLYIDNLNSYSEYQFLVYPTSVGSGAALFTSSEVPGFYKFSQAHLYAIPKSEMPANFSSETYVPPENAIVSETVLGRIDTLPDSDSRTVITTHYTVSIVNRKLVLTEVSTSPPGNKSSCMFVPGLVICLMLGYLAVRK